ncbi:VENN motif pre-toxin domain-containing protein [Pectobacterium versatile]|uniref:VENN motif pre-toxin domain-containing protein n=1 Tax=Pectobacterium versatile TaxID=2488639 RepID=UPI001968FF7F|nr:VENN motif pre-toxin domain-containing protein [Pectobacterium versatile]MBN3059882.1 VENN motif pre-toxin domain-containing protein [Pectobacterium versatile]
MGGTLLLRDTAKQVQDTTTLSRDVEHANNALSPIFNKEKEQKRLKQAQLIGEIGAQVMDIVRTEGELKAQKAAEAKGDATVERPKEGDPAKEWETYKKALTESPTYKAEMQKYGTGSDFQRAAQAATAAIQALAGGDIQKAIASGASPYLAQLVKDVTIPKDESKITASDIAANAMAHAVVGAVVAQLSGQDAAAGAMGASSGELIARAIMADQYPGKTTNDLTEEEKQSVSALSTLASGLVSGLAGNSTASAASGAQSGRNAVENNFLNKGRPVEFAEKLKVCSGEPSCEQGVRKDMAKESAENIQKLKSCWEAGDSACVAAMRSQIETDGKAYAQLGVQDALAGRSYENSANWYADIIEQCAGKCGWPESALAKTAADGLTNAVYGALGTGSLTKPGQTVEPTNPTTNSQGVTTSNAATSLKVGESRVIDGINVTRVGRWMSPDELAQMQNSGKVIQGGGGQTFISINGASDFKGTAPTGSVYAEFDVSTKSLLQGGKDGWFKLIGPDASKSQQFMLNKQGGTQLPDVKNISIIDKNRWLFKLWILTFLRKK